MTNLNSFFENYTSKLNSSMAGIDLKNLNQASKLMIDVIKKGNTIYVCGNGGSAALANHFACDHQKILNETKKLKPFLISLSANSALMTAISNDEKYENVYSDQINQIGLKNDILITISSSGSSKNIVKAIMAAKKKSIITISLTGFKGGTSKTLADINLHVNSENYGIIESLHHTIMNLISQFLKNKYFSIKNIKKKKF